MYIEISLIIILAIIFFIYLRKWPETKNNNSIEKNNGQQVEKEVATPKQIINIPISENEKVIELVNQANDYFNQENYTQAEKLYLKAASLDPKCVKALSRLGVIYLKLGKNWEDAQEALEQALKIDPKNGYILNNLGLVLYNLEKYDQAIEFFEKSINTDRRHASRFANLGLAYFAKRLFSKAQRTFKKAVMLEPDNHEYQDLYKEALDKQQTHRALTKKRNN